MKKNKIILFSILMLIVLLIILIIAINKIKNININEENEEIPIEDRNEAGTEYTTEQLENVNIEISGLTEELQNEIGDINQFVHDFKEYLYLNGLIDANEAKIEDWQNENDILQIRIILNDINNSTILIEINNSTSDIRIYEED